ncbi:MAG: cation-transporting P-type ATPase [Candidatus Levybacteria bacterium]|nr:cation-transporting P-type ATPase [Candidatus Levybacteria bacterium]
MPLTGLSYSDYKKLLSEFGQNVLPVPKTAPAITLLLSQFKNLFSVLLVAAILISVTVGDLIDGYLILVILLLNAGLGFWQEYKASREINLLRRYEPPKSRVVREGVEEEVLSETLVPGDIVILEAGDKIPADGILLEGYEIDVNESTLTGESVPVGKTTSENENKLFLGTWVTSGNGKMQITSTGANTKFGNIARNLGNILEEKTPLETALNKLALKVTLVIFSVALFLAVLTIVQGVELIEVFFATVALIIAAVPEGLPAIITVLLAVGVRRMYRKKSLIRKMSAIENLGTTDVICIDKTGTITTNQMSVRQVEVDEKNLSEFMRTAVVCNSASLIDKEDDGFDILGDTMEGAMLVWSKNNGARIESLRFENRIVREIPFDSKRKMMSVFTKNGKTTSLLSKGAPEIIIPLCQITNNQVKILEDKYRKMADQGLRVLALAHKQNVDEKKGEKEEAGLRFLGLIAIADEPRPEAKTAIEVARKAGIEIVMITGDNELTAKSIGQEVGLLKKDDEVVTGKELDELSDGELKEKLDEIRIYARTTPEHKLRIVTAFQETGKIVTVTGDGVNDSLALKKAHIGIAMGKSGTDVAKEAADIVILDDNLSTIVSAVEQGRLIYSNIVKVVRFLLTGNLSEVLLIAIVIMLGYPIPLLPAQILWVNFVTDGLPAISLAGDKSTKKEMLAPPRGKNHSLFDIKTLRFISFFGVLIAVLSVFAFLYGINTGGIEYARKITFTTMIFSQMAFVLFIIRRGYSTFSNKYLNFSIIIIVLIQVAILTFPPLSHIFGF